MTVNTKRPNDSEVDSEAKKVHIDLRDKGWAAIKAEFVIKNEEAADLYINDDDAEGGDRDQVQETTGKKKKKRGQNKNRDLRQEHGAIRLCTSLVDPDNAKECRFGAENCRSSHNIEEFLASKEPDVEGICPVFDAIGYCPAGLKCRWLGSHYDKETNKLLKDLAKIEVNQEPRELNRITNDAKIALQKKKYEFKTATKMISYLDSQVKNEAYMKNLEEKKDNQAEFVEVPFRVAEKKRLNFKNAKIVSPLTTVGNLPYRRLMKTLGADVTYGEMALTVPLLQGTNAEWALPKAHKSEYPGFGVQFAAGKHWSAAKAAEIIYRETPNVSELNLNCGCPIDLLYRQGQGSALMEQPSKLMRILKGMNYCSGDIPVTVKIRTGTKDNKNTAKSLVGRLLEENEVAAITLHGRSRQQRYSREADWGYVGEVAQVVQDWNNRKEENKDMSDTQATQFLGNGDVYTFEDWYAATNTPGIDSVMVARGALIKPWIFEEVEAQQYLDKSASERLDILRTYANFAVEHWGTDEYGIGLARRFMCEFLSFYHRYIPVGILERLPPKLNERPPKWKGRNDLETLLGSSDYQDWIKITEMFLGKAGENFHFTPKHKSSSYEQSRD
ncbi:tRNA-dihydrouridine synthase 3 [Yamadazyma tenuis]|uniref:tRNA-dihydrouridine(47) synthase [NAD(P)(+)] n=1 Tax=Candida tenuis (strain ATCC 10573 / BCRC 21748 / CBS 615 / JCM 9827 / NBRC 10315 / NRRL Y-1498 / VKM Y-70) TaxID=590646 RepID=G3AWS6_CANTC|nr:uncharacterized protein CANTEDRAFT_100359 [Yamadazyma tenuis ATCC 10573]EGV66604.1 hypothetical protein CANTEDRAFT_100359 [Yamadazyma tenuis ATCC 10573]WEJ95269.1 tRNA-dihydrouridine synthase 3 [Yamadazyma tenuis]